MKKDKFFKRIFAKIPSRIYIFLYRIIISGEITCNLSLYTKLSNRDYFLARFISKRLCLWFIEMSYKFTARQFPRNTWGYWKMYAYNCQAHKSEFENAIDNAWFSSFLTDRFQFALIPYTPLSFLAPPRKLNMALS